MHALKTLLKKYFSNFAYFYIHLRYRIFVILFLSILVGVMDGFGLAMFLPLLEIVSGGETSSSEFMGNLAFLVHGLEKMNLSLNLTVILITMLIFFSLKGFFKFLEQYKRVVYQQYFIRNIREESVKALADYDYNLFMVQDAGRIQNSLSGESQRVSNGFIQYMKVIQYSILMTVYTVMAFLVNPGFSLLVLAGGLISNFAFNRLYHVTKSESRRLTRYNHAFQGLVIQQVAQFKYLKATALIHNYARKLISEIYRIEKAQRKLGVLDAIMIGLREPILIAVVVAVIFVQVNLLGGSLALILLSILFFYRVLMSVTLFQTAWNRFLQTLGSIENITHFIKELKNGKEKSGGVKFECFKSQLSLKDVNFRYDDVLILKNISLDIQKYNTIAIVGESGSGKTTMVNILSGLLKPNSGDFFIDGTDSRELDLKTYQQKIGYITQEPVIFSDTIFNNVTFWSDKTTENIARFREALYQADILEFVDTLPFKKSTHLGHNGINLSGGQKQRVSIARELYKEAEILIMDEATSALDSETEQNIQKSIDRLKGKYTILIIAHRLSTIRNADQVIVLDNGRIECIGSYQTLMKESSTFNKMVKLQEV